VCTDPASFADGWQTEPVDLQVQYRVKPRLWVLADCVHRQRQPAKLVLSCGSERDFIDSIEWPGWDHPAAKGYGTQHTDNCVEGCPRTYRAVLRLSQVKYCRSTGRYQYTLLKIRYPHDGPPGPQTLYHYLPCKY
jgi:hypothetical protein